MKATPVGLSAHEGGHAYVCVHFSSATILVGCSEVWGPADHHVDCACDHLHVPRGGHPTAGHHQEHYLFLRTVVSGREEGEGKGVDDTCIPLYLYNACTVVCCCRIYTPFNEGSSDNSGIIFLIALGNVAVILVLVVVMTIILVLLFKYRCYLVSRCSNTDSQTDMLHSRVSYKILF